jgi:hypothetical protein
MELLSGENASRNLAVEISILQESHGLAMMRNQSLSYTKHASATMLEEAPLRYPVAYAMIVSKTVLKMVLV